MPTRQPTPEERDERVRLPLDPEEALKALMETGPHPDDETASDDPSPNESRRPR